MEKCHLICLLVRYTRQLPVRQLLCCRTVPETVYLHSDGPSRVPELSRRLPTQCPLQSFKTVPATVCPQGDLQSFRRVLTAVSPHSGPSRAAELSRQLSAQKESPDSRLPTQWPLQSSRTVPATACPQGDLQSFRRVLTAVYPHSDPSRAAGPSWQPSTK
ncbi:hypothetical protein J6590_016304 [Homalodisca vitripennis]|nr:hypothetical protein J6590_016304 [Homalodisca vitripennis]